MVRILSEVDVIVAAVVDDNKHATQRNANNPHSRTYLCVSTHTHSFFTHRAYKNDEQNKKRWAAPFTWHFRYRLK